MERHRCPLHVLEQRFELLALTLSNPALGKQTPIGTKDQYDIHGSVLDQPVAALIKDLRQRGLLEETLVVWCTEFGRMPTFQRGASGRDHNPAGFTCFLAGADVKAPFTYGATDLFGYKAVENVTTVYDFYATVLHILGLDHERLSFYHNALSDG